jgi:hypothetical protein
MAGEYTILVEGSDVRPFLYSTRLVIKGLAAASSPLEPQYLYGDGDLAVFLEDLGVDVRGILLVLGRLHRQGNAEAPVTLSEEILEVLSRHARGVAPPAHSL